MTSSGSGASTGSVVMDTPDLRYRGLGPTNDNDRENDQELLNYLKRSSPTNSMPSLSLDQILVAKLEKFINSTLASLEGAFKADGAKKATESSAAPHLSKALLIYQSLTLLKTLSTAKKFEILDAILDDHYGDIFEKAKLDSSDEKLLLGLEFIDFKLKNYMNLKSELVVDSSYSELEKRHIVSQTFRELNIQFHNYDNAILCGKQRLLHYWELPFPWRENKFIVFGYRFNDNYWDCIKSIFQIHNETGNIWTHLFGFFVVAYLTLSHFPSSTLAATCSFQSQMFIYLFLVLAMKTLVSSVCWHTFNSTSNLPVRSRFACIDYTGITVLITVSIITTEYCALYYFPRIQKIFIGLSILMGLSGFFFTWSPQFDTPKARPFRIGFFISLALFGMLSFVMLLSQHGIMHSLKYYMPITKSLLSYLTGVVFYGFLFPECCRRDVIVDQFDLCDEILNELNDHDELQTHFKIPNKTEIHDKFSSLWWIDYCCSSHNIWHLFVLGGILFHYTAMLDMFENIGVNKI